MSLKGASMGLSRELPLDLIVYVDPVAYYNLPYSEKDGVAKAVGRTNWKSDRRKPGLPISFMCFFSNALFVSLSNPFNRVNEPPLPIAL